MTKTLTSEPGYILALATRLAENAVEHSALNTSAYALRFHARRLRDDIELTIAEYLSRNNPQDDCE